MKGIVSPSRGYQYLPLWGRIFILENPLSQKRQAEVDKIIAEHQGDRYELQDKLMPYELQAEYKRKNQRLGDENE